MPILSPCDTAEHDIFLAAGTRFHHWTVVGTPERSQPGHRPALYPCQCDCGEIRMVGLYDLLKGQTKHCIRCRSRGEANSNYRHGHSPAGKQSKLYMVWNGMKRRCANPNTKDWANYGGRGIKVCNAWLDYRTFRAWATANGYAEGLSLERKDNDGNYEPANCCWIPQSQQSSNRRSKWRDRITGSLFQE